MKLTRRQALGTLALLPIIGPITPHWLRAADAPADAGAVRLPAPVRKFIAAKEQQVQALAKKLGVEVWPDVTEYFAAARRGDWPEVEGRYGSLRSILSEAHGSGAEERVAATARSAALEVNLVMEQFAEGEPGLAEGLGGDLVALLPKGSIYFGGTDSGRGLPTAFCASHAGGDPAFVLTQNALADGSYLTYLRDMFGDRIEIPSKQDSEQAFQDYLADAQRRLDHDEQFPNEPRQVKPGEDIRRSRNRVTVSGQVAVMAINGALARVIFDRNPTREFYIEESSPLEWMYPHLSPHGLILRLHREPVKRLPDDVLERDRKFWIERQGRLIGTWLKTGTPVPELCQFAETVWVRQETGSYGVNPRFIEKPHAGRTYSKLRSAIGGVYAWRARQTNDPAERDRLWTEADFAFRQAFALYPGSGEAVFRYVNLLVDKKRFDDALCLVEVAGRVGPDAGNFRSLERELQRMKTTAGTGPKP